MNYDNKFGPPFIISKYFQLKLRSRIHIFFFLIKKIIKLLVK